MSSCTGFIYGLKCPKDNKIRYVGQTTRKLSQRLSQHIRRVITKDGKLTKKEAWIKNLINESLEKFIEIIEIEECIKEELNNREKFWISELGGMGDLTNLTWGGTGVIKNKVVSKEKLSEETKKKISEANSGVKNGMYGKKRIITDDVKEKTRINMINSTKFQESRKSEKYRNKISDIVSKPLVTLNVKFEFVMEFKNSTKCAEYFDMTRGNIKNAVRQLRKIGKGKKEKFWVVRKEKMIESIIKIKSDEEKVSKN